MTTFVVLPSFSQQRIDRLTDVMDIQFYEAEMLFALLLLAQADESIVYVSSMPVENHIVEYYLDLLPDPEDARRRLELIPLDDPRPVPLISKLMTDTDAIELVKGAIPGGDTYLFPLDVTENERSLATALGIRIYGPAPDLDRFGTKSGSRQAAREAGVAMLAGAADVRSMEEVEEELERLRDEHSVERAVVKLDRGFGGGGNAIVDLTDSPLRDAIAKSQDQSWWRDLGERVSVEGAIVEEHIDVPGVAFPSVQLRIAFDGAAAVVSSHDQLVAGPEGQHYVGAVFPACGDYRSGIEADAIKVGRSLASLGVLGMFGIDFIVVPCGNGYECFLNEINLRLTAAVRNFVTARSVTDGEYDSALGALDTPIGPRVYVAADNLWSDEWAGHEAGELITTINARGLGYNKQDRTGIVLQFLPSLAEYGRFGAVCIAESRSGAKKLLDELMKLSEARTER